MINVAHFRSTYLGLTETFIYQYLKNFRRINPFVFTYHTTNLESFPFPEIHSAVYRPYFWGNIVSKIGRHLMARDFKVESLIERLEVSVLHAHFGPDGYHLLPVKRRTGIPLVTTFYGFDMSLLPRRKEWMENYRRLFACGDVFLVEGSHMKKELVGIGCPEEKARILHIAVDIDKVPFRRRMPKARGDKVIILFCGSFVEKKGLIYALEAVAETVKDFPSLEFRIIGDGTLRGEVESLIRNGNLEKRVKLLGSKGHDEVIRELDTADIFLHPSVTAADGDSEGGAPTIIIEAQAAGLPVVSTLHADIPEVVISGETGFLVEERNTGAIAERLRYLLTHQESWSEMGTNGREHIAKHYNIRGEIEKLEDIYLSLAGGAR